MVSVGDALVTIGVGVITASSVIGGQWVASRNTVSTRKLEIESERKDKVQERYQQRLSALGALAAELKLNAEIAMRGGSQIEDDQGQSITVSDAKLLTDAYYQSYQYLSTLPSDTVDKVSIAYAEVLYYVNAYESRNSLPDHQRIGGRLGVLVDFVHEPCQEAYEALREELRSDTNELIRSTHPASQKCKS